MRTIVIAAAAGLCLGLAGGFAIGRYTHVGDQHAAVDAAVETLVQRAENALAGARFDEPEKDNVLDLTDQILTLRPDEPRARAIRERAADRLVRIGLERKSKGALREALAAYELAAKFTRPDHGLLREIDDTKEALAKMK